MKNGSLVSTSLFGLALCVAAFLLAGCAHESASPGARAGARRSLASPPASASRSTVASSPLYLKAVSLCKQNRYQSAADVLLRLSQTPELSQNDREFCLNQRLICLSHLKSSKITPPSLASLAPQPTFSSDCGPRALLAVSQRYGMKASLAELRQAGGTTAKGTSMQGMTLAAKKAGWKSEGVQVNREALPDISLPAIAWADGNHYLALLEMQGRGETGTALIQDPSKTDPEKISQEVLLQRCGGYLLLLKR